MLTYCHDFVIIEYTVNDDEQTSYCIVFKQIIVDTYFIFELIFFIVIFLIYSILLNRNKFELPSYNVNNKNSNFIMFNCLFKICKTM